MSNIRARVRMKVEIEIGAGGVYGEEWNIKDIYAQAHREGLQALRNALKGHGGVIVGEPELKLLIGENMP